MPSILGVFGRDQRVFDEHRIVRDQQGRSVNEQVVGQLVQDIAKLYLSTAAGIAKIVAERDETEKGRDMPLPIVASHQVMKMSHDEFCNVVATQKGRMTDAG